MVVLDAENVTSKTNTGETNKALRKVWDLLEELEKVKAQMEKANRSERGWYQFYGRGKIEGGEGAPGALERRTLESVLIC